MFQTRYYSIISVMFLLSIENAKKKKSYFNVWGTHLGVAAKERHTRIPNAGRLIVRQTLDPVPFGGYDWRCSKCLL
jgi:hypothetical protein